MVKRSHLLAGCGMVMLCWLAKTLRHTIMLEVRTRHAINTVSKVILIWTFGEKLLEPLGATDCGRKEITTIPWCCLCWLIVIQRVNLIGLSASVHREWQAASCRYAASFIIQKKSKCQKDFSGTRGPTETLPWFCMHLCKEVVTPL